MRGGGISSLAVLIGLAAATPALAAATVDPTSTSAFTTSATPEAAASPTPAAAPAPEPDAAPVPVVGDQGPTKATLPGDKITITGDHFVIEDDKHQAIFTGNVVTVHPEVTVHSDKVVTFYGKGGASNITTFQATGHVKLVTKDQTATGELAVFDPKTHFLTLTGNVVVINKTGRVQSTKLVVDLKTKKSVFTTQGGRVTGVFNSE